MRYKIQLLTSTGGWSDLRESTDGETYNVCFYADEAEAIAALNFFQAAIAAVELATVIATPIPKFKKGTSWVDRGKYPMGDDTIPAYLDEGERVVSKDKNVKHWDLYEAIDSNRLNTYVMKQYVTPILQEQSKKRDEEKQVDFAGHIANNIQVNGMSFYDHDELRRKGVKITNTKQISKEIAQEVATEVVRALIRERGR